MAKPSLAPFALLLLLSWLAFLAACSAHPKLVRTTALVTPAQPRLDLLKEPDPARKPGVAKAGEEEEEEEEEGEHEEEEAPGEMLELYLAKRVPEPGAPLPSERYFAARERIARMRHVSLASGRFSNGKPASRDRQISLGSWTSLGPANIAGRSRVFVFHPQNPDILFLGAAAGGVWKSVDAGKSWTPLGDLLPNLAVNALAIDPRNPNILYAGTGEGFQNADAVRGLGIFKSTDGGQNWTVLPATYNRTDFFYVNKLIISPFDPNRLYATTRTGIWRTLDGGASWTQVLARPAPLEGCHDMAIRTDQGRDYLFATCGNLNTSTNVFRNKNAEGDDPWELVYNDFNSGRAAVAIAPSNPDVVYLITASLENNQWRDGLYAVLRSTSAGDKGSWEVRVNNQNPKRVNTVLLSNQQGFFSDGCTPGGRQSILSQGWYDMAIAVDPVNPDRVWVGGVDASRSDDGGANWGLASDWNVARTFRTYIHADHHFLAFHPNYDGDKNRMLFFLSDGGIFRTDDALAGTLNDDQRFCTEFSNFTHTDLSNGLTTGQFFHGLPYPGGHIVLGGKQDNGTSRGSVADPFGWSRIVGGDGGYVAIAPDDPNRIYAETTRLSLLRSTNGISFASATRGITEPSGNFLFITPFRMDPSNSQRLYLGGRTLWRTDDGANNWTAASAAIPTGNITAIAVAPSSSDRVVFGTNTGRVYRSLNPTQSSATDSWDFSQVRLTGTISWIEYDPTNPDTIYATVSNFNSATATGHVFRSTNGGVSWTSIDGSGDTGIPDIPVHSIAIDPADPLRLYLGTDAGIFASYDGGATWAKEDTGFVNTVVESLTLVRENGASTLYAFTHGRGSWRVTLNGDTPKACDFKLPPSLDLNAVGQPAIVRLEAAADCTWSAVPGASWSTFPKATGQGPADLALAVSVNTATTPRSTTALVGPFALPIRQDGATPVAGNSSPESAFRLPSLPFVGNTNTREFPAPNPDGSPVHSCTNAVDSRGNYFVLTPDFSGALSLIATSSNGSGLVLTAYEGTVAAANEKLCQRAALPTARLNVEKDKTYFIQVSGFGPNNAGGTQAFIATRVE